MMSDLVKRLRDRSSCDRCKTMQYVTFTDAADPRFCTVCSLKNEAADRIEQQAKVIERVCEWTDDGDGVWEGQCGAMWIFEADGPKENECNHCMKCGGKLALTPEIEK